MCGVEHWRCASTACSTASNQEIDADLRSNVKSEKADVKSLIQLLNVDCIYLYTWWNPHMCLSLCNPLMCSSLVLMRYQWLVEPGNAFNWKKTCEWNYFSRVVCVQVIDSTKLFLCVLVGVARIQWCRALWLPIRDLWQPSARQMIWDGKLWVALPVLFALRLLMRRSDYHSSAQ